MQETYVQQDMFAIEEEPQTQQIVAPRRRLRDEQQDRRRPVQQVFDFSGVDFTDPQVRQSVARGAQILISYAQRRLS